MFSLIPYPRDVQLTDQKGAIVASVGGADIFPGASDTLSDYARRIFGLSLPAELEGNICFFKCDSCAPEEYILELNAEKITLYASSELGANHAAVTLLQLISVSHGHVRFPIGRIHDVPDKNWRGFMLDLARVRKSKEQILSYIDMCRFYKIRYFHLHFNDDQSYTLPSARYPALSTPESHYSFEDIREILAYAAKRGVTILPELDMPGHCTAFQGAYPEIFGDDGILCIGEKSMAAIEEITGEFCETFADAEYIHIGADEANILLWTKCEKCREAMCKVDPDFLGRDAREQAEFMYAYFVSRICRLVKRYGKKPVIWEGVSERHNHMIPKDTVVMSWENFYQTTSQLTNAGFRVINCSWKPLYVVKSKRLWSPKTIYDWNVHEWEAVHTESPYYRNPYTESKTEQVMGAQLLAWSDGIWFHKEDPVLGAAEEMTLVEQRIPALAENTWNVRKVSDWAEFSLRARKVASRYQKLKNGK